MIGPRHSIILIEEQT